jgi:hypothetical protein
MLLMIKIIRCGEELDTVTLRCRIFRSMEVGIPNLDTCGLIQPDVIPVGVEGDDIPYPTLVRIAPG